MSTKHEGNNKIGLPGRKNTAGMRKLLYKLLQYNELGYVAFERMT